jgi:hypothetical protein
VDRSIVAKIVDGKPPREPIGELHGRDSQAHAYESEMKLRVDVK